MREPHRNNKEKVIGETESKGITKAARSKKEKKALYANNQSFLGVM